MKNTYDCFKNHSHTKDHDRGIHMIVSKDERAYMFVGFVCEECEMVATSKDS